MISEPPRNVIDTERRTVYAPHLFFTNLLEYKNINTGQY